MSPCCHGLVNKLESTACESDTTKAPGMRNVRNARIQNTNDADPANCTVDAFGMNRTRATKMTTRSKEFSTLATKVGATFSEIMSRSEIVARSPVMSAAMEHLP